MCIDIVYIKLEIFHSTSQVYKEGKQGIVENATLSKVIIKNALNMSHGNMFKDSGHTYTSNEHHPYNMRNKKPSGQFILIFRFPCLNTIHVQKINTCMINMG